MSCLQDVTLDPVYSECLTSPGTNSPEASSSDMALRVAATLLRPWRAPRAAPRAAQVGRFVGVLTALCFIGGVRSDVPNNPQDAKMDQPMDLFLPRVSRTRPKNSSSHELGFDAWSVGLKTGHSFTSVLKNCRTALFPRAPTTSSEGG